VLGDGRRRAGCERLDDRVLGHVLDRDHDRHRVHVDVRLVADGDGHGAGPADPDVTGGDLDGEVLAGVGRLDADRTEVARPVGAVDDEPPLADVLVGQGERREPPVGPRAGNDRLGGEDLVAAAEARRGQDPRPAAPQLERRPRGPDRSRSEGERARTGRLVRGDCEGDGDVVDRPDPVDRPVWAERRDLAQPVEGGRAATAEHAVRAGDVPRDRLVAELARVEVRLEHVAVGVRHEPARQVDGDALGQTDLPRGLPGREVEREQSPTVLVGADDEPRVGPARQQPAGQGDLADDRPVGGVEREQPQIRARPVRVDEDVEAQC
jgi:hypothetical protein